VQDVSKTVNSLRTY